MNLLLRQLSRVQTSAEYRTHGGCLYRGGIVWAGGSYVCLLGDCSNCVDPLAVSLLGAASNCINLVAALPNRERGRDLLALDQEAVGGELGAIADGHAIVDVRIRPEGDVGAEGGVIRLEGGVLLRVALDRAHFVEYAVVADSHQRPLRDTAAVVENPAADPGAKSPQDHVDERRAGENCENRG